MRFVMPTAAFAAFVHLAIILSAGLAQGRPANDERPAAASAPASPARDFARWEKAIAAFEAQDRDQLPPPGGVLFLGSSTIRRWTTLAKDFPGRTVVNRGFGGSHIVDSTHFADRIIFPYRPRMIFLRAGGNDVNAGKSPEQVLDDYKAFVATVRRRLPETRIVYISISPSPSNEARWNDFRAVNRLIETYSQGKPYLQYLETFDMVLGPDGRPRAGLFVADRLHMNAEGYRLLADRVRPLLPVATTQPQNRSKPRVSD